MNTNRKTAIKESKMKITASTHMRLAGLSAMVAGLCFIVVGMFTGIASEINLGILPALWTLSGPMFILGTLLFGIATFRAGILPRWAAGLLAVRSMLIPAGALLPPEYDPGSWYRWGWRWHGWDTRSFRNTGRKHQKPCSTRELPSRN